MHFSTVVVAALALFGSAASTVDAARINVAALVREEETRLRQLPIVLAVLKANATNFQSLVENYYSPNVTFTDPFLQLNPASPNITGRDNYLAYLANLFQTPVSAPVIGDVTYEHPGKWMGQFSDSVSGIEIDGITTFHFNHENKIVYHRDLYTIPFIYFNPKILGAGALPTALIPGLCIQDPATEWQFPGVPCPAN